MKIIVCVKQVPDTSGRVAVKDDGTLDRASMATITNPDNPHYAGHYASQLQAYRDVLSASGLTVRDTLIYYSVMGCPVRLNLG